MRTYGLVVCFFESDTMLAKMKYASYPFTRHGEFKCEYFDLQEIIRHQSVLENANSLVRNLTESKLIPITKISYQLV